MASGGPKRRQVCSLDGEVLERLSMKLNPRMLMKDYQSLAGRFKYTYDYIQNFARERDPTLALLNHWWSSKRGKEKTVTVLMEHLSAMQRDDCVDLLQPYEFWTSHEASELDERSVIAGAADMNINPYNPYFTVRNDNKSNMDDRMQNGKFSNHNGYQSWPSEREYEHSQKAPAPSPSAPSPLTQRPSASHLDRENPQRNASAPERNSLDWTTSQLNQNMLNMRLGYNKQNFHDNRPAMVPTTSTAYANANYPSSVSSSMDSLQFEKHFLDYENAVPKMPLSSLYEPSGYVCPEIPMNSNMFNSQAPPDEYHGSRRDLRLHGVTTRPKPLDGSSASTSESGDNAAGDVKVAADKVALVIGNQDYAHPKLSGLLYPEQDAADVADALRKLHFKVISLVNLTLTEMRSAMLAFCGLLGRSVYGVVYYAGHGYEDNGENYLLPVDSDLKYNREQSLRTQEILEEMQLCETSLNLLIIDACRVSLPNKTGTIVPRIKRSARGNNIFAFSCCSQQESLEKIQCRNGMYCKHLLRRLGENRRVENVLMDVAADFARDFGLAQRPCIETDTRADFRLSDPIQPGLIEADSRVRCSRWREAQREPKGFSIEAASLLITMDFRARFSNILCISVITKKRLQNCIEEFHLTLETVSPLRCVVKPMCDEITGDNIICKQMFELQDIQKHIKLPGSIILKLKAMFREDSKLYQYTKEFDLGWPLISSITSIWDRWLSDDDYKSTTV